MTDLLVADLHISPYKRDAYRLEFLAKLGKLARKHNADYIFILGDLTDQKDEHKSELVNAVVDCLVDVVAEDVGVVILKGNHDYKDPSSPYFGFLRNIEYVEYISEPTYMGRTLLLPHTSNYKRDWGKLKFNKDLDRIYTHNTFKGATSESGQELDGIPLDAMPYRIPVYSGDVHKPQIMSNLTYVGAPYLIDFGDDFRPRCLLVDDKYHKSIQLDGPQKRVIQMHSDSVSAGFAGKAKEGDIVRVELSMRPEDYSRWSELRERIIQMCHRFKFKLDSIRPIMEPAEKNTAKVKQQPSRTDKQVLLDYCKYNEIDKDTRDLGLELL